MNSRKFHNLFAFVAIGLIAVSVLFSYISTHLFSLPAEISYWCNKIAYYLACISTFFCAFVYAKSRRSVTYVSLLILFVAIIIIFTFIL